MSEKGTPRFQAFRSLGGGWFIEDGLDGSRVAVVFHGSRAPEKTAAMARVMVDALNRAGTRGGTKQESD